MIEQRKDRRLDTGLQFPPRHLRPEPGGNRESGNFCECPQTRQPEGDPFGNKLSQVVPLSISVLGTEDSWHMPWVSRSDNQVTERNICHLFLPYLGTVSAQNGLQGAVARGW